MKIACLNCLKSAVMSKLRFRSHPFPVAIVLFLLVFLSPAPLLAQGDLMVFPKRIVFEGSKRTSELNLANVGKDTARYNISFVQYKMNEDGSFTEITVPEEGQYFADKFLRFYPRSVVLAPKESQLIKIQLTKTDQMKPGEYRSHIYFRATPNLKALGESEKSKDTTAVSIRLIPIFGITIPAIIRMGENTTKVTLSDLNFTNVNDTIPTFQVTLNRIGNMSVYGDLKVSYISPQGNKTELGVANGISVYTPIPKRRFQLQLSKVVGINFKEGKLIASYSAPKDAKVEKYAEAELPLK